MDILEPKLFDATQPLSKAIDELLKTGTAVFVTKNNLLFGLIDDRNIRMGIANTSKVKCENVCVKCPSISESATIPERIDAFLSGHFKALPVLNAKGKIIGITSRTDLLRELNTKKLIPHAQVYQYMNFPVYTVELGQTIADVKSEMKKTGIHHLIITRKGKIVGTISTFDFVGLFTKQNERQSHQMISEVKNFDSRKVDEVYRENFVTIEETETIREAAMKMANEGISSVIVIADKKPIGVLAATDIFRLVRKLYTKEKDVLVSGLNKETLIYYSKIKQSILNIVNKFDKSLKIEKVEIHIKKGKSIYEARAQFYLNNKHIAFKCEAYNLDDITSALSSELKIMLEKCKSEKMKKKKRSLEDEE